MADQPLLSALVQLLASAEWREKTLKLMQYSLKLVAHYGDVDADPRAARAKRVYKHLSLARRCFKLGRFVRHLDGGFEELCDPDEPVSLQALRTVCFLLDIGSDVAEDLCTLDRLGGPRAAGGVEMFGDVCWFASSVLSPVISYVELRELRDKLRAAVAERDMARKRKLAQKIMLMRLGVLKCWLEVVQSGADIELHGYEGLGIFCGLMSAMISTNKATLKALK